MFKDFEAMLTAKCALDKGAPIVVGVSGGPDSLCLLDVLHSASHKLIVAHFDHQLRAESHQDAQFVEDFARSRGLPFVVEAGDVRGHAEHDKLSVEEAARALRYDFLFRTARAHAAQAVAVGHTADDQVETVLMHFLRGSGLRGLTGMKFRAIIPVFDQTIPLVRPLLGCTREEVLGYVQEHGLKPHMDASNASLEYERNRIRHELLPLLEHNQPALRAAIIRMADALQPDFELLEELLDEAWKRVVLEETQDAVTLDLARLLETHLALRRGLMRRAMQHLVPGLDVDHAAIERACDALKISRAAAHVDLKSGLRLRRELGRVFVYRSDSRLTVADWPQLPSTERIKIQVPTRTDLGHGWVFSAERCLLTPEAYENARESRDRFQVWLGADSLPEELELRVRARGDRIQSAGLEGHSQKLSDLMVNEKMPQRARARWPILCTAESIVWIPGYRAADAHRLTNATRHALHCSVTQAE